MVSRKTQSHKSQRNCFLRHLLCAERIHGRLQLEYHVAGLPVAGTADSPRPGAPGERRNRLFLYCITLGLAILTNYYISIMLCIFMFLYFICLMIMLPHVTLKQFLIKCGRFALYSLIAGGLGAILLPPGCARTDGNRFGEQHLSKNADVLFLGIRYACQTSGGCGVRNRTGSLAEPVQRSGYAAVSSRCII